MERLATIPRAFGPARDALARWGEAARMATAEHRLYLGLIALYALCGWAAAWLSGGLAVFRIDAFTPEFGMVLAAFGLAAAVGHALWSAVRVGRDESLLRTVARDYTALLAERTRLARFAVGVAPLPFFLSVFSSLKRAIPYLSTYDWDSAFAGWDRWLHLGHHPWELLMPLLGGGPATTAVNAVYNAWFFVVLFTLLWVALRRRDPRLRMRFLLAFLVTWVVLGNILAAVFASGGPVYYGRLAGGADPFAPLMAHLHALSDAGWPVWSLAVQERLWESHAAGGAMLGGGISAMPSMHVAMAVLMALFGWRVSRAAGVAYTLFAAAILTGSVHLGWHYAIDGYAAILLVPPIWWACGRISER